MNRQNTTANQTRLMSIDALRGFDMWFITGGASLVTAICTALGAKDGWLCTQMTHVAWEGFRHHDTIFPLFLFLSGVSWPFSLASQIAKGRTSWQIHRKVVTRALVLFAFGLSLGGILKFNPCFRMMSVLGFIGLSWGTAAILFMHVKRLPSRLLLVGIVSFAYFSLLHFFAAPGSAADAWTYAKESNIITWLDRLVYPEHLFIPLSRETAVKFAYEPESLFAVPSGMTVAFLGMLAGSLLRSDRFAPGRKALCLLVAGAASLAIALTLVFVAKAPVVKALWTTSFVASAAAYSFLMLALFYWTIDVMGWRKWTLYFCVIGMNSITVYMAQAVVGFAKARDFFFGGLVGVVPSAWSPAVSSLGYLAVVWAFLYFLYRRRIFLKV